MNSKVSKLVLDGHGSFLGVEKGALSIRDRNGESKKYPLFENEIGEVVLRSGNCVSSGALATMGFWGIDCMILTQKGHPVALLKSLDDDSHVQTRVCQYEALKDDRAFDIAKKFVLGKFEGQNHVLKKYGLKRIDYSSFEAVKNLKSEKLKTFRRRLNGIEGKVSEKYFSEIFQLFNFDIRPSGRKTFKAYDGVNNLFNLGYEYLRWKVHIALIKAKLEPYLGFLHSTQFGKPSLICDFQELYRYLIDNFVIEYSKKLDASDFIMKIENYSKNRKGKRQYLSEKKTREFAKRLSLFFRQEVDIPRVRVGKKQEIETLINEEAMLFAKHLIIERTIWSPRIAAI